METIKISDLTIYGSLTITFLKFLPRINEQLINTIKKIIEQWRKF